MLAPTLDLSAPQLREAYVGLKEALASPMAAAIGTGVLVFLISLTMILVATWRPRRRRTVPATHSAQFPSQAAVAYAMPQPVAAHYAPSSGFVVAAPQFPPAPPLPQVERFDLTRYTPPAPIEAAALPRKVMTSRPPAPAPGPKMPRPAVTVQSAVVPPVSVSASKPLPPVTRPASKPPLPVAKPASKPPLPVAKPASKPPLPVAEREAPPSAPPPSIEPRVLVLPPPIFIQPPASVPPAPVHLANVADLDFEDDNPTEFSEPYFDPEDLSDARAVHATAPRIRKVEPEAPRFHTYESHILLKAAPAGQSSDAIRAAGDADDAEPTSRFGRLRAVR
jgi:hypothetical protein